MHAQCKLQTATNNGEKLGAKISCEGLVWCDCRIFLHPASSFFISLRQRTTYANANNDNYHRDDGAKNKDRARRQYNQWWWRWFVIQWRWRGRRAKTTIFSNTCWHIRLSSRTQTFCNRVTFGVGNDGAHWKWVITYSMSWYLFLLWAYIFYCQFYCLLTSIKINTQHCISHSIPVLLVNIHILPKKIRKWRRWWRRLQMERWKGNWKKY